ncbi:MAG: sugar nucleotide-binding protein [Mariprofundaceae bacterium]|nr:sugar nucleotide-binding protein [Mariprofundaceae bacterium]
MGSQFAKICQQHGIHIKATARSSAQISLLQSQGMDARSEQAMLDSDSWLDDCTAVLDSIPLSYDPQRQPSQSQSQFIPLLLDKLPTLSWLGYLSATSVYGDSAGTWINEDTPALPSSLRGKQRLLAEQAWLNSAAPAEIFRLSGIYGHERNILSKLFAGNCHTIHWQPEHFSNRMHVFDIVAALFAAMRQPQANRIINMVDDYPCSHQQYVCALAQHIGAPAPIILSPQEAETQLSPAFLDFFRDNKRISNQKLHQTLLAQLKYPSFHDAIDDVLAAYHLNLKT